MLYCSKDRGGIIMNKDLKLKMGDKVTFLDYRRVKHILYVDGYDNKTIEYFEGNANKVLKVERPVKYETIYEYKEILDDVEREYLGNFIRPFRNKISGIMKRQNVKEEWIYIFVINDVDMQLPPFKKGKMYKNMKVCEEYTLEELGL